MDNLVRTNNDLEGWHNRFAGNFQGSHEHIWKLIKAIRIDSILNHHKITQALIGAPIPAQRQIYRAINERVRNLVATYNEINTIDILRGVSYSLS